MLYKVRDFVNRSIFKSTYYTLFKSHINYAYIILGQKKALRIINFKEHNAHSSVLFHCSNIINIEDKAKINNCLFINKYTTNKLSSIFTNWFIFSGLISSRGNLQIYSFQTTYGKNASGYMAI